MWGHRKFMCEVPYQTEPTESCWSKPRPALPNCHLDEKKKKTEHDMTFLVPIVSAETHLLVP